MDTQVQNDSAMQYGHMPERRDSNLSNLDSNVGTPFQSHQGLGQALGTHLPPTVGPRPPYHDSYPISPPPRPPNGGPSQTHPSSHGPLAFSVPGQTSPGLKRKPIDGIQSGPPLHKRRRDPDDGGDSYDNDGGGQGAKHWTDEEKSRLFNYLMGPGQDDHWNALRATKNSCLRECANEIFGGKKTYQALKGCYERNFNLFKQIYAFESYHAHAGSGSVASLSEADRLREYERRLQAARKAGCDVGNITARTIDHWHRIGWYDLFYRRWHGDPATTRPTVSRTSGGVPSQSGNVDDLDGDDDNGIDFADPTTLGGTNGLSGNPHDRTQPAVSFINPQSLRDTVPPIPPSPVTTGSTQNPVLTSVSASASTSSDQMVNITLTQGMVTTYLQFLQAQTQTSKLKLEYLRRREEREEKESLQRREIERLRQERESAEFEHNRQSANVKQRADRAIEVLGNPSVDASLRQAAGDYLKKLFTTD